MVIPVMMLGKEKSKTLSTFLQKLFEVTPSTTARAKK